MTIFEDKIRREVTILKIVNVVWVYNKKSKNNWIYENTVDVT